MAGGHKFQKRMSRETCPRGFVRVATGFLYFTCSVNGLDMLIKAASTAGLSSSGRLFSCDSGKKNEASSKDPRLVVIGHTSSVSTFEARQIHFSTRRTGACFSGQTRRQRAFCRYPISRWSRADAGCLRGVMCIHGGRLQPGWQAIEAQRSPFTRQCKSAYEMLPRGKSVPQVHGSKLQEDPAPGKC